MANAGVVLRCNSNKLLNNAESTYSHNNNNKNTGEIWENNSTESESAVAPSGGPPLPSCLDLSPICFRNPIQEGGRLPNTFVPLNEHTMSNLMSFNVHSENDIEVSLPRNRFRFIQAVDTLNNNYPRTKSYYKFKVFPWTYIKVTLDRLKLLALLDRNLTLCETFLAIILGILVGIFGAILLYLDFYDDLSAFIFCFIIASSQYSLLKSVQPDAASPTHGFNRIIAYSRPIYFCIFSSVILTLHFSLTDNTHYTLFSLYGVSLTNKDILITTRDFLLKFILFFPFLFSLGLFPQVNTFVLYLLEQIDMHIFGGNAMSSLIAAFYCVFRSCMAVIVLYGLAYGGLTEPKGSQHFLFSIFCSCLVSSSYHLSRSASDPSHIWNILKANLWPPDIYREHKKSPKPKKYVKSEKKSEEIKLKKSNNDQKNYAGKADKVEEELVDPLPHKLQKTVNARLTNDVIMCSFIAVFVLGIHMSTVFTALQPELSPVLWCIAGSLGFLLHYIIPQMRKQLPWLCVARPILKSYEHDYYQVRGPAKIMWFEKVSFFCE